MDTASLFAPMQIIIGAYILYAGISGKTEIFGTENMPQDTREQYNKMMRRYCFIVAPMLFAGGALDYFGAQNAALRIAALVVNALVFLSVVAIVVLIVRMRKRSENK